MLTRSPSKACNGSIGGSRLEILDAGLLMSLVTQFDSGRNYAADDEFYHLDGHLAVLSNGNPGDHTYTGSKSQ